MRITICYLYPDLMSIYGDRGNVMALTARARWRGIDVEVIRHSIDADADLESADLFFFGGGQDTQQVAVGEHLRGSTGARLRAAVEGGAALLAICGGYQLLGHYFRTGTGEEIRGISLLDLHTVAGNRRFIGDVVVDVDEQDVRAVAGLSSAAPEPARRTLVGFENHSGLTYLGPGLHPLGRMSVGCGNNGRDGTEGAVWRACIGCYLHGSLLPKNPALTDLLLEAALKHRTGVAQPLPLLDDSLEDEARAAVIARVRKRGRLASAIRR